MTRRFNVYMTDEAIANKIRVLSLFTNMTLGETFNFLYRCWELSHPVDHEAMEQWWQRTADDMRGGAPYRRS